MAVPANLSAALGAIDTATTNLGTVVSDLRTRISTAMSQEDVDAVTGKLGEVATALNGIAADPSNPVPSPPVQPLRAKP